MANQVFTWIDPDGVSIDLNEYWDFDGRFMPPITYISDALPGEAGEVFRAVRHGARVVKISTVVDSPDCVVPAAALRTELRALVYAMDPERGLGTLRVTNPGGDVRDLKCRYQSGLELPESYGSTSLRNVQKATITFIAHQPYWEASSETTNNFDANTPVNFFPIFPIRLTTSQIFVSQSINNVGNKPTWPIWQITGPGSVIVLKNLTTGQKLDFSNAGGLVLDAGEYITIDTNLNVKSVRLNDGTNLFKYLSFDSDLWALPPGPSTIELQMAGVDVTESSLQLKYTPRYLTV